MLKEYMLQLGYSIEDYDYFKSNFILSRYDEHSLLDKIKTNYAFLISLGYSHKEIIKMTKIFPSLYGYTITNIEQKINNLMSLGYNQAEVIKMTTSLPSLYGYSIANIKQKINDLMSLGYSQDEIIDIIDGEIF